MKSACQSPVQSSGLPAEGDRDSAPPKPPAPKCGKVAEGSYMSMKTGITAISSSTSVHVPDPAPCADAPCTWALPVDAVAAVGIPTRLGDKRGLGVILD
ncbi:hypothetical protein STEG23_020070 [Scotinomys teguina]